MNALIAGQTDFMCADVVTGAPQYPDKVKLFAVTSPQRNAALPNVPSVVEAGLPAFQPTAWNGLFAPKGTPQPIVARLVDALDKALDDAETRKRLDVLGGDIPAKANRGPAPFLALVKSEIDRWSPIIKAADVKMN
jgi:tripartite-type tricarboxylate transporter receptor subunit TctC